MTEQETYEVVPNGDVIFTYSPSDNAGPSRIRACSSTLRRVSTVFEALLGPKFKEGSLLAGHGYVEVPLPEDDPSAMLMVLNALHNRNHALPSSLPISALQAVGVVVDKYDCAEAIAPIAYFWINKQIASANTSELKDLLEAAYHLHQPDLFAAIGQRLLMDSSSSVMKETGDVSHVLNALEAIRQSSLMELSIFLEDIVSDYCHKECYYCSSCDNVKKIGYLFMTVLTEANLLPLFGSSPQRSLAKACADLRVETFAVLQHTQLDWCSGLHSGSLHNYRQLLLEKIAKGTAQIEEQLPRLCLACVQTGQGIFKRADKKNTCKHADSAAAFTLG